MRYIGIIKSCYPSLSKTEKKVADYFIDEKENIIYQTLLEISKKIKVGEATIIRFVKKIGFSGFQELKLEIAKEYKPEYEENYENYINRIEANMVETITNTKALLVQDNLNMALDLIMKSKRLYFYGVGASGLTANEAQSRFVRMGKMCISITDNHFQRIYSSTCSEGDVIIAFSLSGNTKDIIESVKIAKKEKAKIIAITSYVLSSLSEISDCTLLTAGKENPLDGGSLCGRISQLYLIDLLCTGYALKNKNKVISIKEKTAQVLLSMTTN